MLSDGHLLASSQVPGPPKLRYAVKINNNGDFGLKVLCVNATRSHGKAYK